MTKQPDNYQKHVQVHESGRVVLKEKHWVVGKRVFMGGSEPITIVGAEVTRTTHDGQAAEWDVLTVRYGTTPTSTSYLTPAHLSPETLAAVRRRINKVLS